MNQNIFLPKLSTPNNDRLSAFLYRASRGVLLITFGLLPVFFLPGLAAPLGFTKSFFLISGVFLALVLLGLAIFRSGRYTGYLPIPLCLFWLFALVSVVASFLAQDTRDALFGQAFEVQSSAFFVLMALAMTLALTFAGAKPAFLKLGLLSLVSALIVFIVLGVQLFLGFNPGVTGQLSLVGSLNDMALYAGFVLVVMLVIATRLDSSLVMKSLTVVMSLFALFILAIVNFTFLWILIGFCSLLSFLYLVSKDTWLKTEEVEELPVSRTMLAIVAIICLVSVSFVVSGDYLGTRVGQLTGVNYMEVRPSLEATLEVASAVYQDNALFGSGPNRFEDAWRLYKNPVINETGYWNTTFISGNGFISTVLITTGLSGFIFLIAFLASFLFLGCRLFFASSGVEARWRSVALVTFSSALYLWTTMFFYTPGPVIMLLAAITTGLTLAVLVGLKREKMIEVDARLGRQYGFMLIGGVLLVVIGGGALYMSISKQFLAQLIFTESGQAFVASYDTSAYDQKLQTAAGYDPKQDIYVAERARLRLVELNRLLTVAKPNAEEQERFGTVLVEGIALAEEAVKLDVTNPNNHALLGSFYGLINASLYEGVAERRGASFAAAKRLDPTNPEYLALEAQAITRFGENEQARTYLTEAVKLKPNYTDALYLLSQLDIGEGNASSAIAVTQSIITIEPRNPARYFQLGLLHLAVGSFGPAIEAFQAAILLDPEYANARYMLALAYLDSNEPERALPELAIVWESNKDNVELERLIAQVKDGDYTNPPLGYSVPVSEDKNYEEGLATFEETNLVSPVNEVTTNNPDKTLPTSTE